MKVLILGSGGREHAFAWKLSQSSGLSKLYIAPGNAGTALYGENIAVSVGDFEGIKKAVLDKKIELVVVGPEDPLVNGLRDFFQSDLSLKNIPVIGPDKSGAMLEGSKDFSKQFMNQYSIPTARYRSITRETLPEGDAFLESLQPPFVLKADGLAAGKGVLILENLAQAKQELREMVLGEKFGKAGNTVVIEEFLNGIELSVFILTDGKNYKILPTAKDYKRVGEGDTGLNTGGMGAVSPVPFASASFMKKVEEKIVIPTMNGLVKEGIDYRGFIFIGLMNCGGEPYVIEYNCRMGDPETEVVLPRIKNDFLELMLATARQALDGITIETDTRTAVTVVLVSGGYPGDYEKGKEIKGIDKNENCIVFHAGTSESSGKILTNGGRVLAITAFGRTIDEASGFAYKVAEKIQYDKKYYRNDIGADLANMLKIKEKGN